MTEQRTLTISDLEAMMDDIHERSREAKAACAREGHLWKDWVELPPDRAGRACRRCSHIEMVQFVGDADD